MVSASWIASLMTASCMAASITTTATAATGTAAPDPIARAEAAFQSGAVRAGMDILAPYWRVLPTDPARQAALADLFARYPSARISALADLRRAAEGFADKAAALAAARLVARATALGLLGPAPGAPAGPPPGAPSTPDDLQGLIATRAAEQNRSGAAAWMLTDPYTEVPGLTTPEAEAIILERTLAHARSTRSAEASAAVAAYLGRHPDVAAKIERAQGPLPQIVQTDNGQAVVFQILQPEQNAVTIVVKTLSASPGTVPSVSVSTGYSKPEPRQSRESLEDRLESQQQEFMNRMRQEEEARRRAEERHRRDVEFAQRRQEGLDRAKRYAEEARQRMEAMNRSYEKQQAEIRRARDDAERRLREERLEREIRLLKEERDAAERRRKP